MEWGVCGIWNVEIKVYSKGVQRVFKIQDEDYPTKPEENTSAKDNKN